ncbi:TIGR03943 family protein [Sphaerisporangium rufum]|uniref:TIGR03943 family protein n=1 Tax=Sphaerisporangium rufum TaxID=1381558 RepID=A0A919V0N7_9ACTN|nr:TIGR03943 family protein [Sphaerisporangium rufum]GII77652.1 TIGR03943 family protein [Sphaerisporangium rufum]
MNRLAQNLVLTLLGGAVVHTSALSDAYLNYVKPGFRPMLVAAGVVILLLGVLGMVQEWRRPYAGDAGRPGGHRDRRHGDQGAGDAGVGDHDAGDHDGSGGHRHGRGPAVAWLLCLPVVTVFLITPPPLGSYAAGRVTGPPPRPAAEPYRALPAGRDSTMAIGEFIGRAWTDRGRSLAGRRVVLTGFAMPAGRGGRWYLTRMQLRCCAADAFPLKVAVRGVPAPREDTWVRVTGTWVATPYEELPKGTVAPELAATAITRVPRPAEPYE